MTSRLWTRRDLLRASAGAAALWPLAGCSSGDAGPADASTWDEGPCDVDPSTIDGATPLAAAPEEIPLSEERFPLGVMAGDARPGGVLLWGFVAGVDSAELLVWRGAPGALVQVKTATVAAADGYLHAPLDGLAPATVYRYAFFSGQGAARVRSAAGRFRTAYGDDCGRPLTVGATVCTSLRNAPFTSLEVLAKEPIDVLCHLGDMSYNDGAVTLDDYRAKWRETLRDPGYRALLPTASMYVTWDDHEFLNNTGLYKLPPERLRAAKDAFFETLPVPRPPDDRLWRSYRWGRTAEFFVLDCRLERKPDTRGGEGATYVSDEQLAWLLDGLAASPAHFKVVLNSVPVTDFPPIWLSPDDRWEGYPAQRKRLLDAIVGRGVPNVWFLSGDFHVGTVGRIDPTGPASKLWEVLVGPGANLNPLWLVYKNSPQDAESIAPAEQFKYFGGEYAATTLTFDPARDAVRIRFLGVDGQPLFDQWVSRRD